MPRFGNYLKAATGILGRDIERGAGRAGHAIEDVTPTHSSHPAVPHADPHPHADLDNIAGRAAPNHVEVPTVPDKVPGRIEAGGSLLTKGATGTVIVYGGVQAVDRFNRTADAVGKTITGLPEKAFEATQAAAAAALAAAEKAAQLAAHAAHGPEAAYNAMLAEIHELEAGAKRGVSSVTGSGSLSTALAVVTVVGTAFTALQFYRAYKS